MSTDEGFKVGDRVTRHMDVYDDTSLLLHGTVSGRYSQDGGLDGITWRNPEVYEVTWDCICTSRGYVRDRFDTEVYEATWVCKGTRRGYFRHGLDAEISPAPWEQRRGMAA
jgi:hypothetical protein